MSDAGADRDQRSVSGPMFLQRANGDMLGSSKPNPRPQLQTSASSGVLIEQRRAQAQEKAGLERVKGGLRRRASRPLQNQPNGQTCYQCRMSKVKCDKTDPCGRCTRLGIRCTPQGAPKKRQRKKSPLSALSKDDPGFPNLDKITITADPAIEPSAAELDFEGFDANAEVEAEAVRMNAQLFFGKELGEISYWFSATGRAKQFSSLAAGGRQNVLDAIGEAFDSQFEIESRKPVGIRQKSRPGLQLNATPSTNSQPGSAASSQPASARAVGQAGLSAQSGAEGGHPKSTFEPRMLGEFKGSKLNDLGLGSSPPLMDAGTFNTFDSLGSGGSGGSFNSFDRVHKAPHRQRLNDAGGPAEQGGAEDSRPRPDDVTGSGESFTSLLDDTMKDFDTAVSDMMRDKFGENGSPGGGGEGGGKMFPPTGEVAEPQAVSNAPYNQQLMAQQQNQLLETQQAHQLVHPSTSQQLQRSQQLLQQNQHYPGYFPQQQHQQHQQQPQQQLVQQQQQHTLRSVQQAIQGFNFAQQQPLASSNTLFGGTVPFSAAHLALARETTCMAGPTSQPANPNSAAVFPRIHPPGPT